MSSVRGPRVVVTLDYFIFLSLNIPKFLEFLNKNRFEEFYPTSFSLFFFFKNISSRNKHVEFDFFTMNNCTKISQGHVLNLRLLCVKVQNTFQETASFSWKSKIAKQVNK